MPVYRGNDEIAKFMPSKQSFIDANHLSPEELADLLRQVSSDENEYQKYLAFRTKKLSKSFKTVALRSYTHPNAVCRLGYYYESKWKRSTNRNMPPVEKAELSLEDT